MRLQRLWLNEYRSYPSVEVSLPLGVCAVLGDNGMGKTNLLEAVAYLCTLRSFRGAPNEALVRSGASEAVVRGEFDHAGREVTVEAAIARSGRNRLLVNRQRVTRARDLADTARVTVFSPDDLELVKGSPSARRNLLDDLLAALHPRNDVLRSDWERALRQRNALLKQTRGRPDEAALVTLDVWDQKLSELGERLGAGRRELVELLGPAVTQAYADVSAGDARVVIRYVAPWNDSGLLAALADSRADDLRRGVTLVGPHRDDVVIELDGMAARTHASQGEQRSLALALRLAGHRLVGDTIGFTPILLLDDVFSELDPHRSAALLQSLPVGQTLLSSAAGLPPGVEPEQVLTVGPGTVASGHAPPPRVT